MKIILILLAGYLNCNLVSGQLSTVILDDIELKIETLKKNDSLQLKITIRNNGVDDILIPSNSTSWDNTPANQFYFSDQNRLQLRIGLNNKDAGFPLEISIYLTTIKANTEEIFFTDKIRDVGEININNLTLDYVHKCDIKKLANFEYKKATLSGNDYYKFHKNLRIN